MHVCFFFPFQDLPVCFFSRHEHHLQYFLLKLAFNLVRNVIFNISLPLRLSEMKCRVQWLAINISCLKVISLFQAGESGPKIKTQKFCFS